MRQMFKGFAVGLAVVSILVAPACRSSRKKNPPVTTTATATDTVPDVATTTNIDTRVEPPSDFVNPSVDQRPTSEVLPSDIESLNRVVQQRGFIRDAFFGYDESTLTDQAQAALSASATWLRQNSNYNLLVEGHCDERGTEQYNLALGDRRAAIVREYLITLGVEGGRIRTVSYGEERPFDEAHTESAWAQNRRAHLVLVAR